MVVAGAEGGGMGDCCLMGTKFQFYIWKEFWRWVVVRVTQYSEYHRAVHLKMVKMVNFILCVSYHNKKVGGKNQILGVHIDDLPLTLSDPKPPFHSKYSVTSLYYLE